MRAPRPTTASSTPQGGPSSPAKPDLLRNPPVLHFAPELLLRAQPVRAAIFDVDGVLTDGRIYLGESGEQFKAFSTLDGHGLKLLARAGIEPIIISGRDSAALRQRVTDLGLTHARFGAVDKLDAAQALIAQLGLAWSQVAAMGDDWPDLALLRRAAFSCAPPGAHAEVRAVCSYVTHARAGYGAARECCDLLLIASGRYVEFLSAPQSTLDASPRPSA
jgi:3-deoxy-D-manno-octulosonate 8-phosphate phosphatase (KDO 8-P phosphatase)